jgi:hypothetical protein
VSFLHHLAHKSAVFFVARVEPLDCLDGFQGTTAGLFPINSQLEEKSPLKDMLLYTNICDI